MRGRKESQRNRRNLPEQPCPKRVSCWSQDWLPQTACHQHRSVLGDIMSSCHRRESDQVPRSHMPQRSCLIDVNACRHISLQRYQSIASIPLLKMNDLLIQSSCSLPRKYVAPLGIHIVCINCRLIVAKWLYSLSKYNLSSQCKTDSECRRD